MGQTQFEFQPAPRGRGGFKESLFATYVRRYGPRPHGTRPDQPFQSRGRRQILPVYYRSWAFSLESLLGKKTGFSRGGEGFSLPSFHCTRKSRLFFCRFYFLFGGFYKFRDAVNFRPGRPLPTGPGCRRPPAPGRTARSPDGPLRPRSSARGRAGCSRQIRSPTGL